MTRRPYIEPRPNVTRVNVSAAGRLCLRSDIVIFDVRDADSYARSHILAAKNLSDANMYDAIKTYRKDQPLLIYCYHGNMSQTIGRMFIDFGFREVYSMDGGYEAWQEAVSGKSADAAKS
jgi:thiosulfate/3-mercaptopyruvate sulfurtransferase